MLVGINRTSNKLIRKPLNIFGGARGSVVDWVTMLQVERSRVRIPMRWIFFNLPNPSSRIKTLGSTQPLTEVSTRNLHGVKGRPARKAHNLTAVCEPIVYKMWEPRRLTLQWASTACSGVA
jgi:hypothetical protein